MFSPLFRKTGGHERRSFAVAWVGRGAEGRQHRANKLSCTWDEAAPKGLALLQARGAAAASGQRCNCGAGVHPPPWHVPSISDIGPGATLLSSPAQGPLAFCTSRCSVLLSRLASSAGSDEAAAGIFQGLFHCEEALLACAEHYGLCRPAVETVGLAEVRSHCVELRAVRTLTPHK